MSNRFENRFSVAGGQGLITAGIILAEAASIIEGKQFSGVQYRIGNGSLHLPPMTSVP